MAWDGNRYGDGATTSTLNDLGTITGITGPNHFRQVILRAETSAGGQTGRIYYGGTRGTLTTAGAYAWGFLDPGESRAILADFDGDLSKVKIIGSDGAQRAYLEVVLGTKGKDR